MQRAAMAVVIAGLVLGPAEAARADPAGDACAALRQRLEREHARAARWRTTWAIVFGAGAVAQGVAAPLVHDHAQRDALYVGAVDSAIGATASLVSALVIDVPPPGASCAALAEAVVAAGDHERAAFYLNHAGGLGLNLAAALVLAQLTDAKHGAVTFAVGYSFALLQTYTMPRWAWHPTITLGPSPAVGIATAF